MFKILVADDEDVIRKGIIAILRRALGPEICYLEAENGIEAFKLCKEHSPQLVITDIRMPFCDGLNFIKNVTENGHAPAFIILSGHADFEYAKSAIKLGVKEYILKPIKKQELIALVEGYVKQLTIEKQRITEKFARDNETRKAAEKLKQKLLKALLDCTREEEAEKNLGELSDLGVGFNNRLMLCAVLQYGINEGNREYMDFAVENIADEVLLQEKRLNYRITVQYDSGRLVALFEGLEREAMLLAAGQALTRVCGLVRKYLGVEVFAGIGEVVYGSVLLHKAFESAGEALKFKLYGTGAVVQVFSQIPAGGKGEPLDFDGLIKTLEEMNIAEILNHFTGLMNLSPSLQALSAIEKSYSQLVETVEGQLAGYNSDKMESIIRPPEFFNLWSFSQLKQEVIKYLRQVQERACAASIGVPNKKLVVEVLRYVKNNASKDINLNTVAEHFDRTAAYMSALFKKGTGQGFNEYLTGIRMEMAKEMLANTGIPIGEVSSLCGYLNPKYFSVLFKKIVGESPAAYRQKSLGRT